MIPKVEACLETLDKGVRKIHIIDGRLRHSLLLEIYTNQGVGTEIVAERLVVASVDVHGSQSTARLCVEIRIRDLRLSENIAMATADRT